MGRQPNKWAKKWIDEVITNEPKSVYRIYDDLYDLLESKNRIEKRVRTGRFIPNKTSLKWYLDKNYGYVTLKIIMNSSLHRNGNDWHDNKQVRHYFRGEE